MTEHGLYFVGESDFWPDCCKDDWPDGLVLASAGGRVRGFGGKGNRYFPNADGIVDADQKDYDDYKHIKEKLGCALTACSGLTE